MLADLVGRVPRDSGGGVVLKENPPGAGLKEIKSGKRKPCVIQEVKF